ncbi:hypothetical protein OOJ91_12875 [Micromonospora lupini]|uniref:hypothetical protein n=1 Tax=Micromonospora lupini TaxID=285679 RepID=UPI00224C989F|nr:hypothetical protein [Micromonospora lupini]MCX5066740.1 hypothetical protein [Micromonospora lupini]
MTGVVAELGALADLLDAGQVPAPHGLHISFGEADARWAAVVAADPVVAGKVGLRPRFLTHPGRSVGGVEYVEVRLSWLSDDPAPQRQRMVDAVRAVAGLVVAAEMPPPIRVDALHALTHVGLATRQRVGHAAALLNERPIADSGSALVAKRFGRVVSYTVHGFLR